MVRSLFLAGLLVVGALAGATFPDYPDAFPDTPSVTIDTSDTNYYQDVVSFNITVTVPATGTPVCGFDFKFGLSATDMTGPLVDSDRVNVPYAAGAYEFSLTDVITRVVPQGTIASDVYPSVTSATTGGNTVQSFSYPDIFLSDSGSYFLQVFAANCDTNEAINPVPGTATVADNVAPLVFPTVVADNTHTTFFTFTDSDSGEGDITGTLTLYVDEDEAALMNYDGFRVYADSVCATGPCDSAPLTVESADFTGSNGVYTATLASMSMVSPNSLYLVAHATMDDTTEQLSSETEITVVDMLPAATHNLVTATQAKMTAQTPEKLIDDNGAGVLTLNMNYADELEFDLDVDFGLSFAPAASATTQIYWLFDANQDGTFVELPTKQTTSDTYGPSFMLPTLSGDYKATAQIWDYTVATPYITELMTSDVLTVVVDPAPQAPEDAVPVNLAFTDTDLRADKIAGDITFDPNTAPTFLAGIPSGADSRQFEYYLVFLGTQDECSANATTATFNNPVNTADGACNATAGRVTSGASADERLGVVAYDAAATGYTLSISNVDVTGTQYIHVTAYETAGQGTETVQTATVEVVDVQQDDATTVPTTITTTDANSGAMTADPTTAPAFYDMNGVNRVIAGVVEFYVDPSEDWSSVGTFEVFLHTSATYSSEAELGTAIASVVNPGDLTAADRVSLWLGNDDTDWTNPGTDPSETYNLDDGTNHYTHLIVVARTATNIVDTVELGLVLASSGAAIEIDDRVDSYYFVNHLATHTGSCPDNFCPGGDPTDTNRYWAYAEQSEGSTNGMVNIYWLTAAMDETVYELAAPEYSARHIELLDNTALDDMSGIFTYRIALGGATGNPGCILADTPGTWPHGAPDDWQEAGAMTNRELYYVQADYSQLMACGFAESTTKSDVVLEGLVTLYLEPDNAVLPANSLNSATEPELSLQASLRVVFSDETHAVIAGVSVDNVLVVVESGSDNALTAEVTLDSTVQFYEQAFTASIDPSTVVFVSGTDYFYVEQSLTSNADSFYMTLERMWFSTGETLADSVEYFVPQSSSAYQNVDLPPLPGRFRSSAIVPYLMNCKPCYMHVVSSLSSSAPTKKALLNKASEVTRTTQQVFVDASNPLDQADSSASCAKSLLAGSVAALVVARM